MTTVLLVGPMTIVVCDLLEISPVPYFMTEIMSSNIGGTATLIGDPPNIMIGSAADLSFFDFVAVDTPAVVIIMACSLVLFKFMYGRKMAVSPENAQKVIALEPNDYIRDLRLFRQSIVMIVVVAIFFFLHGTLHLESSVIALSAACIMLLISRADIEECVFSVEWHHLHQNDGDHHERIW